LTEDILEPVDFKDAHARNTSEYFEDLVRRSRVDERANIKTVKEIRVLEAQVKEGSSSSKWWRILRGTLVVVAVICGLLAFGQPWYALGTVAVLVGLFAKLNPHIKAIEDRLAILKQELKERMAEAWEQMEPLNRLYHWRMFAELVKQTVPRIELDPYFSNGRLNELRESFGWNDQVNEGASVVFAHSGALNGNPLVIAQTLHHWMGTKTYEGSLTIRWTERVKDSQGNWRTETKTQTLRATVEKPFPEYGDRKFVVYGNEAAPDLSFTRSPSSLSGLGDGAISKWRKARAVKKLESKSRDMKSDFTVMSNREFDSLFGATDRDHEVQFRLLFTALAQQEMVKLLNDKTVGYGDTFEFTKARMVNVVEPGHMQATDISADPARFQAYELAYARTFFNEYQNDLFKSVFFGLAPLLVIPLYQQHRSHADIYRDVYGRRSSFWEHESLANYFGEERFQHPDCITRSILKTQAEAQEDGTQVVRVAAFGYRGVERVDYVPVYGGDGNYHNVPVEWVEYLDVRRDSEMVLQERDGNAAPEEQISGNWQDRFQRYGIEPHRAVLRRAIVAALR
jgi:hypothetical protein